MSIKVKSGRNYFLLWTSVMGKVIEATRDVVLSTGPTYSSYVKDECSPVQESPSDDVDSSLLLTHN